MNRFAEKHPKAAEWVRKGGLFLIFSWAVTALKAVILMFLPALYHGVVGDVEWLFPGIPVEMFGVGFKLSIIGNALEVGADGAYLVNSGLAFTLANLTAIFFGECINFPLFSLASASTSLSSAMSLSRATARSLPRLVCICWPPSPSSW